MNLASSSVERAEAAADISLEVGLTAFQQAAESVGDVIHRDLEIGGSRIRLCFAGGALVEALTATLAHSIVEPGQDPDLTISIWDAASTGSALVSPKPILEDRPAGEVWLSGSGDERSAYRPGDGLFYRFDRSRGLGLCWLPDAAAVPFDEQISPLRHLLSWWFASSEHRVVHAAAVGTPDGGLLIGGANGAGKSTTSLACLHAGLSFGGDNWILVRGGDRPTASALYAATSLRAPHVANHPELLAAFETPLKAQNGKTGTVIGPSFYDRLAVEMPLRAIVLPRVGGQAESSFVPVSRLEALKAFVSNAFSPLQGRDPETLGFLATLVRRLPAYQLTIGSDLQSIPETVSELISTVGVPDAQETG